MLYNEFIEGTGCKDNEKNYKVYQELEIIYMNTDCTKEHIYEIGKKLVDNSKSEEQIQFENQIKEQIEEHKKLIEDYRTQIDIEGSLIISNKEYIKYCKEMIAWHRRKIRELRWILK